MNMKTLKVRFINTQDLTINVPDNFTSADAREQFHSVDDVLEYAKNTFRKTEANGSSQVVVILGEEEIYIEP